MKALGRDPSHWENTAAGHVGPPSGGRAATPASKRWVQEWLGVYHG